MLEKLAHWNGVFPDNQHFVKIEIPPGTSYEVATAHTVPGWDDRDFVASRLFGTTWFKQQRSAILFVPSIVARMERNLIINSLHPEFQGIQVSLEEPVWWDQRLFQSI